jgi:NADH-quinone oxidoreductase subunit E
MEMNRTPQTQKKTFQLSKEGIEFVKKEMARYETKLSAIIPSLYRAQDENGGWVGPEVVDHLSQVMDIPQSQIEEVLDFYTMFNKQPVGRYHLQVCTNISCAMAGGREIVKHLCNKLKVHAGEVTKDGKFTVSYVECAGSCDTAPVMQINRQPYNEKLTISEVDRIVDSLK